MSYGQYSQEPKPSKPQMPTRTKREKHVFSGNRGESSVEHIWANPMAKDGSGYAQDWATNPGKNLYFKTTDGARVLYSYRDSYPIANLFTVRGKKVYLLRSGKAYSVTTAGHISAAMRAIPDGELEFQVPEVTANRSQIPSAESHNVNLADYVQRITDAINRYQTARSSWKVGSAYTEAKNLILEVKKYCRVFKLKLPSLPKLPTFDVKRHDLIRDRESKAQANREAKQKAIDAEYLARHEAQQAQWLSSGVCTHEPRHDFTQQHRCEAQRDRELWDANKEKLIEQWRAGANVRLQFEYHDLAILRVIQDTQTRRYFVETSQHVSVPVTGHSGALRLYCFLTACKSANRTYQRNGHSEHIGNFVVDSFDGDILKAGCHKITWSEIQSIAEQVIQAAELERAQLGAQIN